MLWTSEIRILQTVAFESLKELLLSEEKNLGEYLYIYFQPIMYDAQVYIAAWFEFEQATYHILWFSSGRQCSSYCLYTRTSMNLCIICAYYVLNICIYVYLLVYVHVHWPVWKHCLHSCTSFGIYMFWSFYLSMLLAEGNQTNRKR